MDGRWEDVCVDGQGETRTREDEREMGVADDSCKAVMDPQRIIMIKESCHHAKATNCFFLSLSNYDRSALVPSHQAVDPHLTFSSRPKLLVAATGSATVSYIQVARLRKNHNNLFSDLSRAHASFRVVVGSIQLNCLFSAPCCSSFFFASSPAPLLFLFSFNPDQCLLR